VTLLVFGGAIVLFITGALAPEVTGLLAAALLVAFGVLKPDEAVQGFGSPALITLMGLFAVSAGLFRSGGADLRLHPQHPDRGHLIAGDRGLVSPARRLPLQGSSATVVRHGAGGNDLAARNFHKTAGK
jgi:hypothetical protein